MSLRTSLISSLDRGRRDRQQPGANGVLGAAQQVAQILDREIEPKAEDLDQLIVALGAGDDVGIAGLGKVRARIVRELADHPAVAAIDDHVGDFLGQVGPARNGEQVILSLGAGNLDQRVGAETRVECVSTSPATAISSSVARCWITSKGA